MLLTKCDFVENKLTQTCFLAFLLMPGARESVQGDRSCADLKLSSSERETLVFTQNTAKRHKRGVFNRSDCNSELHAQ